MDTNVLQEIRAIWNKLNEIGKKLSDFIDVCHAESTESIATMDDNMLRLLADLDFMAMEMGVNLDE